MNAQNHTDNRVSILAIYHIKQGQKLHVKSLMQEMADASSNESGNLLYQLNISDSQPDKLFIFETYENQEALDLHKQSSYYQNIVAVKVADLLACKEVFILNPLSIS
ncbi:MAG: putative quinol monooxygenase [Bacteroidota bacterium]